MSTVLIFWLCFTVFVLTACFTAYLIYGINQVESLDEQPFDRLKFEPFEATVPKVSIVVTALNEASHIRSAIGSLLSLNYPNYEVIAVNDRSSDETGAILDEVAQANPSGKLRILHIHQLPDGWLGKTHALAQGAAHAQGEYILFTDADIEFKPNTLSRAVQYCEQHRVDHLTMLFGIIAHAAILKIVLINFSISLMARFSPWRVASSATHYFGVGAFNLVRRSAYEACGGHNQLKLSVIDDIGLGKMIKSAGFRQRLLEGRQCISVQWYPSLSALIKGLEKNIFAGFEFSWALLTAVTLLHGLFRLAPWFGAALLNGPPQWFCIATITLNFLLCSFMIKRLGWPQSSLIYLPVVGLIEPYIWWRGALLTASRGGIFWRGTFYSLKQLQQWHWRK